MFSIHHNYEERVDDLLILLLFCICDFLVCSFMSTSWCHWYAIFCETDIGWSKQSNLLSAIKLINNKRVKMTFNRSHEFDTKGKLATPPGGHVF